MDMNLKPSLIPQKLELDPIIIESTFNKKQKLLDVLRQMQGYKDGYFPFEARMSHWDKIF